MNYEFDIECTDKTGAMYVVTVDVEYSHDDGVWYDRYGEGCSPSSSMDYDVVCIHDEEGNQLDTLPDEIDLEELVWIQIENEL